ncbi:MAG: hypothetical protein ABSD57_13740 [Verrucomicrobiota bacterium]
MKSTFEAKKIGHGCPASGQRPELSLRLQEIFSHYPQKAVSAGNSSINGRNVATPPFILWPCLLSSKIIKAMLILVAAGSLIMSVRAQDDVYAVEFNQSNNRFGILDLLTGNFTQISVLGGTIYNDIAYNPQSGTLYGIQNNCANLVTIDKTTGDVAEIAPFNVSGIESLAFQPDTGVLYGCAQSGLYTINPLTAEATLVGSFGTPYNLNTAQNIRFDTDGNLYLSNTSDNTDIYQVSTQTGQATFVGEAAGYADLILMNAGQYMYGVSIPAINGATAQPELLSFDLSSFVVGGTNADGSIHQVTTTLVGGGPAFPVNFDFSGVVPAVIPPPWSPKLSIAPQGDGSVAVTASGGRPSQTYVFQFSTNMANWTALSTNTADSNGAATIIDVDAKQFPGRFYRTASPNQNQN